MIMMRIKLLMFLALFSTYAFSQIQSLSLDNGLNIIVKEDHRAPVAVTMLWYNVGSADEPGGLTGVSHVLEHYMFKGTQKFPLGVFTRTIAAFGGELNAMTNNDFTAYYEITDTAHLPAVFELEANRMQHLLWNEEEFKKEMRVIQEERRLRIDNEPQALMFERFLATAHLSAPYHHPVIGWMTDLQHMNMQDAQRWYQQFYAPNNVTLVVVGDVKPSHIYQLAKQYFGSLQPKPRLLRKQQLEPEALGSKHIQVQTSAKLPMFVLGYTVPTPTSTATTKVFEPYALELIAGILGIGDSGRFSQNLEHGTQVANNINVFYNLYARYQTQFIIYGSPSQSHSIEDVKAEIHHEIKRLQTQLVSQEELQRVKTQIIAQKTFEKDSMFGQAMELGLLQTIGLGWQATEKYVDRIKHVTPEQIQQTAIRYFQESNFSEARGTK
jgi:zinc protease